MRDEGFEVGIGTHLKLAEVLKNIPPDSTLEIYAEYICPVIAKSETEQTIFLNIFPQYADWLLGEEPQQPAGIASVEVPQKKPTPKTSRKRLFQLLGLLLLLLLANGGFFLFQWLNTVEGCTDPTSLNFNPEASKDDGSCIYETPEQLRVLGCMDSLSVNFNPEANQPCEDCCVYEGCMDSTAINYNPKATQACNNCCEYGDTEGTSTGIAELVKADSTSYKVSFASQRLELPYLSPINPTGFWLYRNKNWLTAIIISLIGAILAFILYRRYRQSQKKLGAQKERGDEPPYQLPIKITEGQAISYQLGFNLLLNQLRGRELSNRNVLDVPKTVKATIKQGGLLDFKFKEASQPTEYLILIDKPNDQNHQAQLFENLYQQIAKNEIYADRYFFDSNPAVCWNENFPNGIRLERIAQKHFGARLLIFGDGYSFINPVTDELEPWTEQLEIWNQRALITTAPSAGWNYREVTLSETFNILPNTVEGLTAMVNNFEEGKTSDLANWKYHLGKDDQTIHPTEENWKSVLEQNYSPSLQRWIAACAIYPELHWDLTNELGRVLQKAEEEPLNTFENLRQLSKLSWFAEGQIPDFYREQLLTQLAEKDKVIARKAIIGVLETNIPDNHKSFAYEEHQLHLAINQLLVNQLPEEQQKWLEVYRNQNVKNVKEDYVSIKELDKQYPPKILTFELPDNFKALFYPKGRKILGQKSTVPWLVAGFFATFVLLFNWFWQVDCYEANNYDNIPGQSELYCLTTPEDSIKFLAKKAIHYLGIDNWEEALSISQVVGSMQGDEGFNEFRLTNFNQPVSKASFNFAKIHYDSFNYENAIELLENVFFHFSNQFFQEEFMVGDAAQMLGISYFYEQILDSAYNYASIINRNKPYLEDRPLPNLVQMVTYDFVDSMHQGRIRVRQDGHYGFLDANGLPTWRSKEGQLPYRYAYNYTDNGTALVIETVTQCPIDLQGNILTDQCFVNILPFTDRRTQLKGYRNEKGVAVIPASLEIAEPFTEEELALVKLPEGKYYFIRKNAFPAFQQRYEDANSFSQGLANVRLKDKWGYINADGKLVIPFRFDAAEPFAKNVARVELGGNNFLINLDGDCVSGQCPQASFLVKILDRSDGATLLGVSAQHKILGNFSTNENGEFTVALPEHELPKSFTFELSLDGYQTRNARITFNKGESSKTTYLQPIGTGKQDRDEDGLEDSDDACPDEFGPIETNGCPDSDGDGVADLNDKCPTEKGTIQNLGCPTPQKESKTYPEVPPSTKSIGKEATSKSKLSVNDCAKIVIRNNVQITFRNRPLTAAEILKLPIAAKAMFMIITR